MFGFKKKKKKIIEKAVRDLNQNTEKTALTPSLDGNIELFQGLFFNDDTFVIRRFENPHKHIRFCILYCDGVVDPIIMNESIVKPIQTSTSILTESLLEFAAQSVVQVNELKRTANVQEIIGAVTYGDTILLAEGACEVLLLSTKSFETRAISEPENEKILSGPREGFSDSLLTNWSMVRRKLRTNSLKAKNLSVGRITKSKAMICYIDGIVNKDILKEFTRRLHRIDTDGVLDTNYITELVRDSPYSPFRTTGYTERPDVVVAKLLEGRIALLLDGTPVVMTVPYFFVENFQSNEDYYLSFYYASFSRMLRILGFVFTTTIPAFYISIVAFHQEMLPTPLLVSIALERQSVPFPAALEAVVMLIVFDILRETGVRMPSNIGQALSIVGALVIGQAAVDAKLVAAPMIIVVSLTGISNLLVPKMNAPIIYIRFGLLALASSMGLFGTVAGLSLLVIHLLNLRTFGLPHVSFFLKHEYKDSVIRAPLWRLVRRPSALSRNLYRQKESEENTDD